MMSLAPIPQNDCTSLNRVYLTLYWAMMCSSYGSFLHLFWELGGLLPVFLTVASVLRLHFTSPQRVMKRVSLLMISAFFFGASVETSECGQNKTWLMVEYHVTDSFFKENNYILKEDFVVCRIKKKMDKEKNVDYIMEAQEGDLGLVMKKMQLRLQLPNMMFKTVLMKLLQWRIKRQQGHGVDDIRINEFQEEMYRTFEDIPVDIPDDWLQNSH
ncbi:hypothetical protein H5410_012296, partial [Solanum commersonii]